MLRRTSRHGRLPFVIIAFALAIISAPGAALGGGPAAESMTGHNEAAAPKSERPQPRVEGRGVAKFDAGRGKKPKQPLQAFDSPSALQADAAPSVGILAASVPAEVTSSGAPAATSFEPWAGLDQAGAAAICPTGQSCAEREPPDPIVAVGPDDVVQTVSTDIKFTTREGTTTAPAIDAYEFFDLSDFDFLNVPITIHGISDVRWLYDAKHARWLGMVMAWHCAENVNDDAFGFLLGALSTSPSPTGSYYFFTVQYDFLPVSPMIGTSGDKIVFTSSEHILGPSPSCTTGIVKDVPTSTTFTWSNLQAFTAFPAFDYAAWPTVGADSYEAPRPAISPQGTSNTVFGVIAKNTSSASDVAYFTITGSVSSSADTVEVTTVDLSAADVVAPFVAPPAPIQPGGTLPAAIDRYPTEAIWQDNVLTFASTYPCDPAGGGSETRDCARITQLDTTTATPTRIQDMLIGSTGKDTWAPGVAQSQNGTLHAVFTQSSATGGMSSYTRYQLPSDAPNTMSASVELADGGSVHYNGTRWGDFTGLAQDPRDANAVWQGNQYTKADGKWATRVSELQTAGATFVPIDPVRVLSSRDGVGLSGPFSANVARSLQIGGVLGIPADAVAVTGNLTVTLQTQAGFLAVTPKPNNSPSTSTLNFPAGDNRANNITSPLATDGKISIVYKATNGKTAHVILDVTGYFLNDATSATYKTIEPARSMDSRDATGGVTGPFVDGVVQSWDVADVGDIPADAVAVTGNLTVTGQSSRGFAAIGPNVSSNPATSTINVPAGDTRANGLTVKLAPDGSLSAVFRGLATTSTAHLIFDVTGFYVDDLTGARFVPMTPGRRLDTRSAAPREGLTGAFAANSARTLIVSPYQGVPNNATAITGNLTVVNQTRAGFVAVTPVATNDPSTSTLNFPLGDIRANGVTTPLAANGSLGLVFKATGGTTHILLDITGYFR